MANSVTFPTEYGGSGITITDDADPTTGLDGTGYTERFVPALQQGLAMTGHAVEKAAEANEAANTATGAAQQASDDRDSIHLDLQTLNGLVSDADASATAAAGSAVTASNMADAVADTTETYTSTAAGLAATADGDYFRVIDAPDASRVSVYRNDAGSATLITTYYTKSGVDAKQAAAVRLNRSLQRLGDHGQTLHSDFDLAGYGLGSALFGGVQDALEAEELWTVERATPTYALQHTADGSLKYVEVPPNTIAREWNPETKRYQMQSPLGATNELLESVAFSPSRWSRNNTVTSVSSFNLIGGQFATDVEATSSSFPRIEQKTVPLNAGDIKTVSVRFREKTTPLIHGTVEMNGTATIRLYADTELKRASHVINAGDWGSVETKLKEDVQGFYIFTATFTVPVTGNYVVFFGPASVWGTGINVDLGASVTFAHAQLVQGTTPGPLIVTEDAPVTVDDTLVSRELGAEFNASGFTALEEFEFQGTRSSSTTFFGIEGQSLNRLEVFSDSSSRVLRFFITNEAGNPSLLLTTNLSVIDGENKVSVSIDSSSVSISLNGMAESYDNLDKLTVKNAALLISQRRRVSEPARIPSASIKGIRLLPKALSAAELQELTQL